MSPLPKSALALVVAGLLALPLAATAGATTTTVPPWPPDFCKPTPSGFERLPHDYLSCRECNEAGDAGLARGDWREYRCVTWPVGMDVTHYLFVLR